MIHGLTMMIKEFKVPYDGHGRAHADKIAIIISDGETNNLGKSIILADQARAMYGIKIYTINVDIDEMTNSKLLKKIANKDCYFSTNYENLKELLLELTFCG